MTNRLRVLFFMTGGTIAILGISVSASDAGPITCAGFGGSVKGAPTAKLNGALSCTGTGQQGQAGPGQDSPTHLNGLGAYGAGWELVAGVPGTTEAFDGSYHLDPAAFQCAGGACKDFVVAVEWEGLVAYFSLGAVTSAMALDWAVSGAAHISVYARNADPQLSQVPEPGTLTLLGLGLLAGARALRRRHARTSAPPASLTS